jgi:hypothetical protein
MHHIGFAPFFRMTALGVSIGLSGLAVTSNSHAQQPTVGAQPAPGETRLPKAGAADASKAKPEAKPADKKPEAAKPGDKKLDAAAKPGDKKAADGAPKPPDKKTRDAARKAYGQGEKAFGEGNFSAAYEGFQKANEQIPSPHALYWMAKSLDKQDKTAEAIAAYEKLLADVDASKVGDEKLTDAKTRIEELKLKLVAVVNLVTVPVGAAVSVDGNLETSATPLSLKLQPGPHKITISAAGYETKEIDLDAKAGDKGEQRVELIAKPAPPPPLPPAPVEPVNTPAPPPPVEKRSMVPAYVTLGIAGAGAVVGTIFGLKALSAKSDFNDGPTTSRADDTERNALISDMAFGVAITLGVTGIVLLTSDEEAPKESAKLQPPSKVKFEFDTYAGKTGGGAKARLRF